MRLLLRRRHQLLFGAVAQWAPCQRADGRVQQHSQHRHQGQFPAVDEHQGKRHHRHQAVDQGFDETGGQGPLDGLHRRQPRGDVAEIALLEEIQRQPEQVREHIAHPLQTEPGRQMHHGSATQHPDADLQHQRQTKAQPEHRQQIAVGRHQHLVDHPLHQERCQHHKHLQRQRQHDDLPERLPQPANRPGQLPHTHRRTCLARREIRRR
ncbi:hypothetical protein D3C71_970290 [compost metagenome]